MGKGLPRSMRNAKPANQAVAKRRIPFSATFVVANGSTAPGIGSVVIGDFPAGQIYLMVARVSNMVFSSADADVIATWDGDWSVGSAPNADSDLTDAADFDIVGGSGGQAIGAATAKVSPTQALTTVKNAMIDNADGSKEINLNVMIDDASQSGDVTLSVTGEIELVYTVL